MNGIPRESKPRRRPGGTLGFVLIGLLSITASGIASGDVIFQDSFSGGLGQFTASGYVYTGSYGVRMRGGSNDGVVTSPAISTQGFTGISVSFDRDTSGLDFGEFGIAEYSVDGSSYTLIDASASSIGTRVTFALGAAASNQSQLRLRFRIAASSFYETYEIDDVVLEGDGDGGGDPPPPPPPPPGCGNLQPGQFDCSTNGRDVNIYVPNSYDGSAAVPLVVDMHGYTSNNSSQQSFSGWDDLADDEGFIVAYPQGVSNSWNAQGQCCGSSNADDVQFIRDVVADIQAAANIDASRIYATGLSNGGSMTHTLACEAADLFAGAAAVSYGLSGGSTFSSIVNNCNPSLGIPVVHFHGTSDGIVSYNNGVLDSLGAEDSLEAWRQVQGCSSASSTQQVSSNTSCQTHAGCDDGVSVRMCTVSGGSHNLYPDVNGAGIPSFAWDFFQQF
jgi:polyhydroxybutyrate depolymerase